MQGLDKIWACTWITLLLEFLGSTLTPTVKKGWALYGPETVFSTSMKLSFSHGSVMFQPPVCKHTVHERLVQHHWNRAGLWFCKKTRAHQTQYNDPWLLCVCLHVHTQKVLNHFYMGHLTSLNMEEGNQVNRHQTQLKCTSHHLGFSLKTAEPIHSITVITSREREHSNYFLLSPIDTLMCGEL